MKVVVHFPGCHLRGGVERVMVESVNYLAIRGHEVHAYAEDVEASVLHHQVLVHQLARTSRIPFTRVPAFVRACESRVRQLQPAPDVVSGFGAAALPGSVVWMQSVHAAWIEESRARRGFGGRLKQRLNPFHPIILHMERKLLQGRGYRKVIALSEQVKVDIQRFYGVPDEDIEIIPNGFSAREFNPQKAIEKREEMRSRLGFAADDQVVIFVANELDRKGFFPLLRAIASLKNPALRLLAVGRLDRQACAAEIASLGMNSRVCFTGPTGTVADYFAAADVFALPTYYEAWGLVIVEALACGLPVLTSRLAGASVAVVEQQNGTLLDCPSNVDELRSKLKALLAGKHQSPQKIAQSVARFEWRNILPAYEAILQAGCNNPATIQCHP